ncbi:hypothetical protein PF005_g21555 [Phytophthora fragariae]|uniref:RxLR effector protein n=1 Tax=Phytophthora fragariae TaxID=53985 RepID=A0A6A3IUW6_9STRA|nr:hypothetical protein PF011_g20194 [Phytophthora fragariae]KAE9184744.1 hypothetical protein PF005_g21555 [Phytophthora fragariae]KAE9239524.1 hypothetical protein PF002_g10226 [Phytophthora fragariae]
MLRLPDSKVILLTYVLYVAFVSHCGDEAGGSVQATDAKLRASCSSVDEAGGVQATDAKLRASCSR